MKYTLMNLTTVLLVLFMIGCESSDNRGDLGNEVSEYSYDEDFQDMSLTSEKEFAYHSNHTNGQEAHRQVPKTEKPPAVPDVKAPNLKPSMIIKNGSMTIEVTDLSQGKTKLDSILSHYGGHYQSENYNKGYNESSYSLVLRIPVSKWEHIITGMSDGVGIVKDKSINATDVTEEYTDLELRLENNEAYLKRYLKLLEKADSIKDMLTIQEKVRRIEEEIESKKGRMKYLKNKVSYSTLHLSLVVYHPVIANTDDQHFGHQIASAFINGYNSLLGFILVLASMWPFLLIAGGSLWFVKNIWSKRSIKTNSIVA